MPSTPFYTFMVVVFMGGAGVGGRYATCHRKSPCFLSRTIIRMERIKRKC